MPDHALIKFHLHSAWFLESFNVEIQDVIPRPTSAWAGSLAYRLLVDLGRSIVVMKIFQIGTFLVLHICMYFKKKYNCL